MTLDTLHHSTPEEHMRTSDNLRVLDGIAVSMALAATFPELEQRYKCKDTLLRLQYAAEDYPILIACGGNVTVGLRSTQLNPTSVVIRTQDGEHLRKASFSVELTHGLYLPYDKSEPYEPLDPEEPFEAQFAGYDDDRCIQASIYIGYQEILNCPELEFEPDRNAVLDHLRILTTKV